jgi:Na+-transporting NADH:ubiquinone oxidoreductase subunit B
MFIGIIPGSIGETSVLMCLIGAFILIITGIASWRIMLGVIIGAFLSVMLFNFSFTDGSPSAFLISPLEHFLMGGFAFGAVFMATDPVSAPVHNYSKLLYGFFIGILCILIRLINPAFPEGMMLSILFMNIFSPLIDHYVIKAACKRRLSCAKY